jgi:hypothetical protein
MGHLGDQIVAIATAIVGVAIVAVILSKNSNTANVITEAAKAFSMSLGTAVSPITGQSTYVAGAGGFSGSLPSLPSLRGSQF